MHQLFYLDILKLREEKVALKILKSQGYYIEENIFPRISVIADINVLDEKFNIKPPKNYLIKPWINPIIKSSANIKA